MLSHMRQPKCAEIAIGGQRARTQHFRQATATDAARQLHLPKPILSMDEAEPKRGVALTLSPDVRHAVTIT